MYKIIACDLDQTLLSTDRTVSKRNIEAIKQATALGIKFVLATGRGYNSVEGTLKEIGLYDKEDEYVISYNGGAITENKGNRLLHFDGIPFDLAQKLYQRGISYNVCIHVYTKESVYAYRFWQEEVDYLAGRMGVKEIFTDSLDFLDRQDIVKILYENTNRSYLQNIERELKDLTQDIDVSYSSNRYIEFNHKGVNKGAGLMFLADLLGVKPEETMAIGDNFNDLSMIQRAGLGIGVQNTIEDMKPLCDYITKANYNESAIAEVIDRFILP